MILLKNLQERTDVLELRPPYYFEISSLSHISLVCKLRKMSVVHLGLEPLEFSLSVSHLFWNHHRLLFEEFHQYPASMLTHKGAEHRFPRVGSHGTL